jgi:phage protein U
MYGLPQVSMMMALGLYVFGLHTVPYQQLQRQTQWRHPSIARVGRRPARQFAGPGDDTITLSGVLYPEITGGKISLAALQAMADEGMAWPLIEGTGIFYGLFVIEEVSQTHSLFFPDGAPRKIEFSLKLTRTDDEPGLLGQVTSGLLSLMGLK